MSVSRAQLTLDTDAPAPPCVASRRDLAACPSCGAGDYLPLAGGWCRCWSCGRRWGEGADPGDPPDLWTRAHALGLVAVNRKCQSTSGRPSWQLARHSSG